MAYLIVWQIIPYGKYKGALDDLLNVQDYDRAYDTFTALGDFKDSRVLADESMYLKANLLMERQDYLEASLIFKNLEDYKDSREKATTCRHEAAYTAASLLFDQGEFQRASESFSQLGDFKDSEERSSESLYEEGIRLLNDSAYEAALTVLSQLANYRDSVEKARTAKYQWAESQFEAGRYEEALSTFTELNDYNNSKERLPEVTYRLALQLLETGEFSKASSYFQALGDYEESEEKRLEADYGNALYLLESKAYSIAASSFARLGEYKDSADKLNESMYRYITHGTNRNNFNQVTFSYLTKLKEIDYEDSVSLYDELYTWKLSLMYLNTDSQDQNTVTTIISELPHYLHIGFTLEGGTPGERVALGYALRYPDGKYDKASSFWPDAKAGDILTLEWEDGIQWSGMMRVTIQNSVTAMTLAQIDIPIE